MKPISQLKLELNKNMAFEKFSTNVIPVVGKITNVCSPIDIYSSIDPSASRQHFHFEDKKKP